MPKNILYLAHHGDIRGGGQISLLELLKNLDTTRFKPVVACPSEGSLVEEIHKLNITTKIIPMLPLRGYKNLLVPIIVSKIVNLVRKERIHLIHSNSSKCALYGSIAAKIINIPHIWHVRVSKKEKLLDKSLATLTTRIIVVSNFVNQRFNWLSNRKISLVYNGVDTHKFKPENHENSIRKEFKIPQSTLLTGTVGQLLPYKGHKFLISAIKEVIQKKQDIRFLIVGNERKPGYKRELLNQVKDLKLQNWIIFKEFRRDMSEIFNALDLFVFPSIKEHFGRVLIEAMACGKPVIAIKTGGVPEIVDEETGILVPPMDSGAIADAILYMIKNRDEAKLMGINARKRVKKLFSLEKHARRIERIYKKLL